MGCKLSSSKAQTGLPSHDESNIQEIKIIEEKLPSNNSDSEGISAVVLG